MVLTDQLSLILIFIILLQHLTLVYITALSNVDVVVEYKHSRQSNYVFFAIFELGLELCKHSRANDFDKLIVYEKPKIS